MADEKGRQKWENDDRYVLIKRELEIVSNL
jgi:hypothetical protein